MYGLNVQYVRDKDWDKKRKKKYRERINKVQDIQRKECKKEKLIAFC